MNDEFYIGWETKAAPGIRKATRRVVLLLLALALVIPVGLAVSQRLIGASAFEWGHLKTFSGTFVSRPCPHLLVSRPGADSQQPPSSYFLVKPFKFGVDPGLAARLDGRAVTLRGTLIYREHLTMIEVLEDTIETVNTNGIAAEVAIPLGRQTLTGEIVDSKCFLGVMNPGQLTPHRACAIRCISGGIPPVLLVRQKNGPAIYLLLVSAEGKPVNQQVLELVAEPVRITGEVERQGRLLVLRADPATYQRAAR